MAPDDHLEDGEVEREEKREDVSPAQEGSITRSKVSAQAQHQPEKQQDDGEMERDAGALPESVVVPEQRQFRREQREQYGPEQGVIPAVFLRPDLGVDVAV